MLHNRLCKIKTRLYLFCSFDMLARSSSAGPFCGSYPPTLTGSPLAWFGPSGILPPHPSFPYSGLSHPAIVMPGIKQEISPLSESAENCR